MALVSLTTARTHLRVTTFDHDLDIALKAELASDIVLDYLKSRAHATAVIETSSVASPTVITTEEAHGYANGATAIIAGHTGSTPALVGSYVVSNVTEFSFTVPVAVTVAGTGGTATVRWTETTAPKPVIASVLLLLTHLFENRGEAMEPDAHTWLAIERLLMRLRDPAFA